MATDRLRPEDFWQLKPRVDRLAFQGQHAEDAFVDAAQRLAADEPFESFDAEGELVESK